MKKIPVSTSDEELKNIIRQWINLLAEGRYDEAAEIFLPEIIPANGSVDEKQFSKWTGKLLETVIYYGGTAFLYEGQDEFYRAAPIDSVNREDFEKRLIIERTKFELFEKHYFGGIEVDLPLRVEEESYLGDLTARIYLRDMGNQEMALVLEDIHVL